MELRRNSWQVQPPWILAAQTALHYAPRFSKMELRRNGWQVQLPWILAAQMALQYAPRFSKMELEERLAGTATLDPCGPDGPPR